MLKTLDVAAVSYQIVLTKADQVKAAELEKRIAETTAALAKRPAAFPEIAVTSSREGSGMPELRAAIARLLQGARLITRNSRSILPACGGGRSRVVRIAHPPHRASICASPPHLAGRAVRVAGAHLSSRSPQLVTPRPQPAVTLRVHLGARRRDRLLGGVRPERRALDLEHLHVGHAEEAEHALEIRHLEVERLARSA